MKNLIDFKSLSLWIRSHLQDKFAHIGGGALLAYAFVTVIQFVPFLASHATISSLLFVTGWAVTKEIVDKKTTGFSYLDILFTLVGWLIIVLRG